MYIFYLLLKYNRFSYLYNHSMSCLELKRNISHCVLITEPLILNGMKLKKFNQLDFFVNVQFVLYPFLPLYPFFRCLLVRRNTTNQLVWVFSECPFCRISLLLYQFFRSLLVRRNTINQFFFLNVHFVLYPFFYILYSLSVGEKIHEILNLMKVTQK